MQNESARMSDKERYTLKNFIKKIEPHRGRGTELVTVYIPAGYNIDKISTHISEEQGTATNIKSKHTRDAVINALEKIIQHLKLYPQTPPNGLAIFAGNVSEKEGQPDYQVWSIEPPIPLNQRLYKCDKEFVVEPLKEMADDEDTYGLIVMDRREGNIAYLKGKNIIELVNLESQVPGKFRAGGQSAQRFARNRELAAKDFYKKIAGYAQEQFYENKEIKAILVGGPGHTKYEFVDGNYLPQNIREKIITIKDLSYTGSFGLQELLEKSQDNLAEEGVMKEKKMAQKFLNMLAKSQGEVTYGKDQCIKALEMGAVEHLLLSDVIGEEEIEALIQKADQFSSNTQIISTETREGVQIRDLSGYCAILRYDAGDILQ